MKRKYIIFVFIFAAVLVMTGCASKNSTAQNGNQPDGFGRGEQNASGTPKMNFGTPASVGDLTIGKKITVIGATNADGTINATSIIIGEMPRFSSGTERFVSGTMSGIPTGAAQNFQPPSGGSAQFQRRSAGGQWSGQTQNGTARQRANRPSGQSRVSGEILKIDESSLVLKSIDGGSKIIFYSDKTDIFNAPTSTPFMRPGAPSSTPPDAPLQQ